MRLVLTRDSFSDRSTQGELTLNGGYVCWTLELPNKDGLPGSCIPQGVYPIKLAPSPKFMQSQDSWVEQYASQMPHIVNIPNRSLIMIHWGNTPEDTDGCVLVGRERSQDEVAESRVTFRYLYELIERDAKAGQCEIEIIGGAQAQSVVTLDLEE